MIAEVVGIEIKDEVLTDGILDVRKTEPIARCGYAPVRTDYRDV